MRKTTKGNLEMSPLDKVEAAVKHLFGGLALASRKDLEDALAEAKKENEVLRTQADEVVKSVETDVRTVSDEVKQNAAKELDALTSELATAVKDAAPEVKTAVDAALSSGVTKILAALA